MELFSQREQALEKPELFSEQRGSNKVEELVTPLREQALLEMSHAGSAKIRGGSQDLTFTMELTDAHRRSLEELHRLILQRK